jgi:uncharacterized protein (DUF362 family)
MKYCCDVRRMAYSTIFRVTDCPVPKGVGNHHEGVDALLELMGEHGLRFYETTEDSNIGGPDGLIDEGDVVLVKVNAQWKYRGCTNSDVVRGLIQRVLEHPDGFDGEVVIFENGQGGGSLDCDTMWGRQYTDTGVHANAEDESHSFSYLVNQVFDDERVSMYLLDPVRETFIDADDHETDGYRRIGEVSYPCFTTAGGYRVELREGVWNGSDHEGSLKLLNVPVLKHHDGCGVTGALKSYYGVLSMADGRRRERHYERIGEHLGEMVARVRAPTLSVMDCIWVTQVRWAGYPPEYTTRLDQLLASLDPVALDYWASKHLLYPIDGNEEHDPDRHRPLRDYLEKANGIINAEGGIYGRETTLEENRIKAHSLRCPDAGS